MYFSAPEPPFEDRLILLNGSGKGLFANVCVPTQVSESYGPRGESLVAVTLVGKPEKAGLESLVQAEMRGVFGDQVRSWRHLRTYHIEDGLPAQLPGRLNQAKSYSLPSSNLFVCGDFCTYGALEGAVVSGKQTAVEVLDYLGVAHGNP